MPRGGKRAGKPGERYPNRSDLQQGVRTAGQPVQAAPNQPYGQRQAQEQAQQVIPLPRRQMAPPPPLEGPTRRPQEPITAGAPFGPGPGPEAIGVSSLRADDVEHLRLYLPAFEAMASQPGASPSFRQMVRYLRGSMPV